MTTRRDFIRTSAAVGAVGLGGLAGLSPVAAADAKLAPEDVRLTPEIEPLVRLIEDTPREKAVETMVEQLRKGVTYRQFLGAMFLAAARMKVSPHHFFMIHSAHQLSLEVGPEDRLLPLFWALDTLQHNRGKGTRFPKVNLALFPAPEKAAGELDDAMRKFDSERAEAALISACRAERPKQAMGRLWHYAARDYGFIGHYAIALSSAWRTLETIGWQHTEPVAQFVVRMLNEGNAATAYYKANVERAEKGIRDAPADWAGGRADSGATLELFALLRQGDQGGSIRWAAEGLKGGKVQAQAVWDAIFLAAAELMVRYDTSQMIAGRPLHTNTAANALRFAFDACGDPKTRLYIVLMAVEWTSAFVFVEKNRNKLRDVKITEIPEAKGADTAEKAIEQIFALQPVRKKGGGVGGRFLSEYEGTREEMDKVCGLAFAFAKANADRGLFLQTARRLVCLKASENAHDVKFPAAIFENAEWVSPKWRPHLLAASVHWLHGSRTEDAPAVKQAREALRGMK